MQKWPLYFYWRTEITIAQPPAEPAAKPGPPATQGDRLQVRFKGQPIGDVADWVAQRRAGAASKPAAETVEILAGPDVSWAEVDAAMRLLGTANVDHFVFPGLGELALSSGRLGGFASGRPPGAAVSD